MRTLEFQNQVYEKAMERDDAWGNTVEARIEFSHDLHASDVVCHQVCSVKFCTGGMMCDENEEPPAKERRRSGRNRHNKHESAFLKVVQYLEENDEEQITVNSLIDKMKESIDNKSEAFGHTYMKRLVEYFGDELVFAKVNGKPNVMTFHSCVKYSAQLQLESKAR